VDGARTCNGGAYADLLAGGEGDDTYIADNSGDTVIEYAGQGIDAVRTSLALYTLGANVENLIYTGRGSFRGTGNALDNIVTGGAGNDFLDGGAGADTLTGGAGNDTYVVDSAGDQVIETGGGTDTVLTTLANYTLGATVENHPYDGEFLWRE
jgi:Ca2+-binding RTX toxin-like protein